MSPTDLVLEKLPNAKRNGTGWRVRCPAHDGKSADSLAISEGDDGAALLHCHSGCETTAVCRAIGIETRDLFVKDDSKRPAAKAKAKARPPTIYKTAADAVASMERRLGNRSAMWTYEDGSGEPMGCVVRWDMPDGSKDIRPVSRQGSGWVQLGMKAPRPLYCLPDLADAERVYVCEGEKAADAVRSLGLIATTSPHGSKSAGLADWQPLAGKDVLILPDNDEPGGKYAAKVIECLSKLKNPPTIKVVELPGLPDAGDAADWVSAGGTREKLDQLVQDAQQTKPEPEAADPPTDKTEAKADSLFDFDPIPASQFPNEPDPEWIWESFIATHEVTMLTALWKAGKTTLLLHLIHMMEHGGRIHKDVKAGRVLYVTEESHKTWQRRFEKEQITLGDHVQFLCRPFKRGKPGYPVWNAFLDAVLESVKRGDYQLVVIDTLSRLGPIRDENVSAEVSDALAPLEEIADAGAGVLITHHLRKGDGAEGQGFRGSGQFGAGCDNMLELRRFVPTDLKDPRRKINILGRSDIDEVVIELQPGAGFVSLGDPAVAAKRAKRDAIDRVLSPTKPKTIEEIQDDWPEHGPTVAERTLRRDMNRLFAAGDIGRTGTGKRNDPYRFSEI